MSYSHGLNTPTSQMQQKSIVYQSMGQGQYNNMNAHSTQKQTPQGRYPYQSKKMKSSLVIMEENAVAQ